jgi:hypothetical protein
MDNNFSAALPQTYLCRPLFNELTVERRREPYELGTLDFGKCQYDRRSTRPAEWYLPAKHTMLPRIDCPKSSTTPAPEFARFTQLAEIRVPLFRVIQNTQFCRYQSKENNNHEAYDMASISDLAHFGPHGSLYGQAVGSTILAGTNELKTSRIRAMWTAVSSPLIHDLFKSTWLA